MGLSQEEVYSILYPGSVEGRSRRFTQDTPILPDVWILFGNDIKGTYPLLLTPHRDSSPAELVQRLARQLREEKKYPGEHVLLSYNDSHVLAHLNFQQMIRCALPLSWWWKKRLGKMEVSAAALAPMLELPADKLRDLLLEPAKQDDEDSFPENALNLIRIVGALAQAKPMPPASEPQKLTRYLRRCVKEVQKMVDGLEADAKAPSVLWSIFSNRTASAALHESRKTVKADASVRLFQIECRSIRFAVIDSGVDASHAAFQRADGSGSRVVKTLDFTRLKELMSVEVVTGEKEPLEIESHFDADQKRKFRRDMRKRLKDALPIDWSQLEEALEIRADEYRAPKNEHGTHVAGILGADWEAHEDEGGSKEPLMGICRDIELYDLRVIGDDGTGDEFCVLAALQYVRFLNQIKGRNVIHGVNISISIPHQASSFACGRTPVCEEVDRTVNSGIVVVVAAGNGGYGGVGIAAASDYRDISITDPGNSDLAITVGATHRSLPHRYGVSYFSSRGPTGDGRMKPDLVAPGEQIRSTIPGGKSVVLDGTSMAAPHVSGAAALLMARHKELIGNPQRVKQILCATATDLGRVRDFQGAGLLDILRALQSV